MDLTTAYIYLKDGNKKMVSIVGELNNSATEKIQYVSNTNLSLFIETLNNHYIESIETATIEAIDIDLK